MNKFPVSESKNAYPDKESRRSHRVGEVKIMVSLLRNSIDQFLVAVVSDSSGNGG